MPKFFRKKKRTGRKTRRRTYKKRKGTTVRKKLTRLNKRVAKVSRQVNNSICVKVYRERISTAVIIAGNNEGVFDSIPLGHKELIERALVSLKFFDPMAPSVPTTADGNSGTFQRTFQFDSKFRAVVKNSSTVPVHVSLWWCLPKTQTSISPQVAWEEGLTDKNLLFNVTMIYPSDSKIFRNTWRIVKSVQRIMQPGADTQMFYRGKFNYDPSVEDVHGKTFYPQYSGLCLLVRLEGVVMHDSAIPTLVAAGRGAVDILTDTQHTVSYDGGYSSHTIEIFDQSDTVINARTGIRPLTDNVAYDAT